MKITHVTSPDFGSVPIIERRGFQPNNTVVTTDTTAFNYIPSIEYPPKTPTALGKQVSGTHYKGLAIQPIEYIQANNIPYMEGNVIKYVTRWRAKAGVSDLEKAKHYLEMLIEFENKNV